MIPYKDKATGGKQNGFDRSLLPLPINVLGLLKITSVRKQGEYWSLRCPFHKGGAEQNPSLSVHATKGFFRCFTCGEKGGDVLAFYRRITGAGFKEAAKALGAWREGV